MARWQNNPNRNTATSLSSMTRSLPFYSRLRVAAILTAQWVQAVMPAGILAASDPDGLLLGFDRDPQAIAFAAERLATFGDRVTWVNDSYATMGEVAPAYGFGAVDGILLDLGLSSRQLADAERGFSFIQEGPLDMRFDTRQGESAADLVNNLSAEELADIFWRYGEERQSRRIARLIVAHRPLYTTTELAG